MMSDKFHGDNRTCPVEASQTAKVCLPVVVKPFSMTCQNPLLWQA